LALWAEVAAASGDDAAPNFRAAAETRLTGSLIDAMSGLKFAAIPFRIDVIRNGRAFQRNRLIQHSAHFRVELRDLTSF
jgi:hypothetical protein